MQPQGIPVQTKEQAILINYLQSLEKEVAFAFENYASLCNSYSRLMNPRPVEADQGQPAAPTPATVEGRLHALGADLSRLNQQLGALATLFDRAI